jgi:hypothetical protein
VANLFRDKGFVKTVSMVCLMAVLGVDPLFAASEQSKPEIPTNFEIVDRLSAESAREVIAGIGSVGKNDLVLLNKAKTAGNVDFVLENAFVREMRAAGFRFATESAKKDDPVNAGGKYRLSYQIVRLSVAYTDISRSWLFWKRVERSAQADLFVQLIDLATGDITWVGEIHKQYGDKIPYGKLKAVEDPQYDFTRPSRSEFKMSRILEPIVVGGIVVGLVYLFFSNQSSE